jgi:kojibiose phosphorylase
LQRRSLVYDEGWIVAETELHPLESAQHHVETVFTLGNGYMGTRGTFEEGYPGAWPATLVHGVYDKVALAYTELANCPDWLSLVIALGGEYVVLSRGEVIRYRRALDLRRGLLRREVRWRSPRGRTIDLEFERFVSLADPHLGGIRLRARPIDFTGSIEILAGINGYPDNLGVKHWEWLTQGTTAEGGADGESSGVFLHARTHHSRLELGVAARLAVKRESGAEVSVRGFAAPGYPTLSASVEAVAGETITVEKIVSIYSSRDVGDPVEATRAHVGAQPDYRALRGAHVEAWARLWELADVVIEGDSRAQVATRFNLFQLLQAAPREDDRVSIPAKTLSGFAYRGHVFWDTELFVVPCLTYTQPGLARNLLSYRWETLPGARRKAQKAGFEGAMFAWESAATGDEVTPRWLPDAEGRELVRIWCGDLEHHISADVAYAVMQYWRVTGDDDWRARKGAEIVLDTAVFWGSRVEWDEARGRFEIRDVIGPDEYHEHVDNNAFTNEMVRWHLSSALEVLAWLRARDAESSARLEARLKIDDARLARWRDVIERLWVPYDPATKRIEQAEGFFALEDLDLAAYEPRHRSIQAILGIEGVNRRQVIKQADVLMLLYLLRNRFDDETLRANWDYYDPRTDHAFGSSLSPAIHAILASEIGDPLSAYEHFMRAAVVDLEDVRGNAAEGIHGASTGALWQAAVFGFGGVQMTDEGPVARPRLPPGWTRLAFKIRYRGQLYELDLRPDVEIGPAGTVAARPSLVPERPTFTHGIPGAPSSIRGVIFDLDGVLTDTAEHHYLGWKRLADEERIPFDRVANEPLRGISRRDSLLVLLGDRAATEEELEEMAERKNRYYLESIEAIGAKDLLPGVVDLLDELRRAGVKIAIGSASRNARVVVERLGIADKIDALSDGNAVSRGKPAPDLFLDAARRLGLPPGRCLVVEDADSGVQAALAAGMWAVALGPAERFREAHLVLPDLANARWGELLDELAHVQAARLAGEGGARHSFA